VIAKHPDLFWGLIASMWIGNFMLLLLNLPLVGLWVSILKISWKILYPIIILICLTGAYYLNKSWSDVLLLLPFALLGYVFKRLDCQPASLIMGFVLGALFEENVRRALIISRGDWSVFLTKPISLAFIIITCVLLIIGIFSRRQKPQR
jgi:TctA family transporter